MLRFLNLPIPIIAAVLVPQIEPPQMSAPAWVAAIIGVAYVLLSYLNWIGRLPGATAERRAGGYGDDDRRQVSTLSAQVAEVYRTVTREDPEKPGWPMVWRSSKEMRAAHEALISLSELKDVWVQDREEWRRDRSRMEARITLLEDTVRRQEHALEARG